MSRILIIGASSVIGLRLKQYLQRTATYEVKTAGRNGAADYYLDLEQFQMDNFNAVEFDIVVHCAASFAGNDADNMVKNELNNSVGSIYAGRLAQKVHCRQLIYLSSISVYEHKDNGYYGSYGLSKRHGEENLQYLCSQNHIGFTSLRLAQVYDDCGLQRKHQGLFYHIIDCARQNKPVTLYGKKNPLRNFLFIEDVAAIMAGVIENNICGIFPCTYPQSYSLTDIIETAFSVYNNIPQITFDEQKADIPTVYIPPMGEAEKLYRLINYEPRYDLTAGIRQIKAAAGNGVR